MTHSFSGFIAAHFDAYEQKKWSSNRYNLERMRVREQAEALGQQVVSVLGDEAHGLVVSLTQDHPTIFNNKKVDSQWVMLCRPDDERGRLHPLVQRARKSMEAPEDHTPPHTQAILSIRVDIGGVEVALRLHRNAHLDRQNLLARLAVDSERTQFIQLLTALPDDVLVTVDGDDAQKAVDAQAEHLEKWIEKCSGAGQWWVIGTSFGRDELCLAGVDFAERTVQIVRGLLPLYQFVIWSEQNDCVAGADYLEQSVSPVVESESSTENKPAPAVRQAETRSKPSRPTTRGGGGGYKPEWTFKASASAGDSKQEQSPSARVRARKQDRTENTDDWRYNGPVREQAEAEPSRDNVKKQRSEEQGEHDGRPKGGGRSHREQRPNRPDRNSNGGRRNHRDNRGGERRSSGRPRSNGPRHSQSRPAPKVLNWVSAEGAVDLLDHVRVDGGLLNGKVGKVVEITKKGQYKIDIGDMVFEVPQENASKVVPQ